MFVRILRASRLPLFYGKPLIVIRTFPGGNGGFPAISKHLVKRFSAGERTSIISPSANALSGGGIGSIISRGASLLTHQLHASAVDDFSELDEPEKEVGAEGLEQEPCSSLEDDDWSELGSVKKESIVIPKLLTEKPELFREAKGKKNTSAVSSLAATKGTNEKGLPSKPSKSPLTSGKKVKAKSNSSSSKSEKEKKNETATTDSNSVTVPDVSPSVVTLRISNLNLETADSTIHSMCTSFGSLEGLARVDQVTVEALFRVRDPEEADSILGKLNDTTVDDLQWSAEQGYSRTDMEASRDQLGRRISGCMEDWKREMAMRMILMEDLEILLHSVLHMKNNPISRSD